MVIFIDESGTHKKTGHATTAIVYIKITNLEQIESEVAKIEEKLGVSSFHWGEERWQVRNKFLTEIIKLDFTLKVAVFKNSVHPERMFEYVFRHLITEKDIKKIFIDGKKPKWYELRLKKILRDRAISVKTLKTVRSETSLGIQMADCLAGLIRRHYETPEEQDPKRWYNKLKRDKKLVMEMTFNTEAAKNLLSKQ